MFSQIQLIVGAVILTVMLGLGATIYFQHKELASITEELGSEKTKNAVQDETIKQMQVQAALVKKLFEDNNNRLQEAAKQASEISKLLALKNTGEAATNPTKVQGEINTNLQKLFKQLEAETEPSAITGTTPPAKGKTK